MNKHYNKQTQKEKRRKLRRNQTRAEEIVWYFLRNRKLVGYKFRRQYSVDYFVIDFYCPELKIAVEIDGDIHDEPEQIIYDIKRQTFLESFGIRFIRIKNEELFGNPNKAFDRIISVIRETEGNDEN